MNVLMYEWPSFTGDSMRKIFKKYNIHVDTFYYYPLASLEEDDIFVDTFEKKISGGSYDYVFSVNYIPVVAIACYHQNIPYVSWSYDNPLNIAHIENTLYFPTNFVFLFDKSQAAGYISQGFEHIWHLPLAADTDYYDAFKPSAKEWSKYKSQIS
ncbi:MAG: DUF3880 domain-containing protein, partial [Lachnospiraceae bacterium]|nr:DUF3880 domain-containing protein [Lachnospiraceae bacterium]